jgi:tRNA A37 threonylcarbamoyladenosine synthetase subunit TsaC/SUA5/YrdC
MLRAGRVLAVKGLGGCHLAADARNQSAVAALRSRKHRADKPFALMVSDVDAARQWCVVDEVALHANGDFDEYWRHHLTQEQHRVHESRYLDTIVPTAA